MTFKFHWVEKKDKNKQKEAEFGPLKRTAFLVSKLINELSRRSSSLSLCFVRL